MAASFHAFSSHLFLVFPIRPSFSETSFQNSFWDCVGEHPYCMLYVFFWVIPRRLNFICRRFGTLCSIFIGRSVYNYTPTCLWRWNRQRVPKLRHIKLRRRGITQKKTHNIQNTAKVWNQEFLLHAQTVPCHVLYPSQLCILPFKCVYMCCVTLRINSYYFPKQH
jgi:hypothetical protein